jgi:hypothetical protein
MGYEDYFKRLRERRQNQSKLSQSIKPEAPTSSSLPEGPMSKAPVANMSYANRQDLMMKNLQNKVGPMTLRPTVNSKLFDDFKVNQFKTTNSTPSIVEGPSTSEVFGFAVEQGKNGFKQMMDWRNKRAQENNQKELDTWNKMADMIGGKKYDTHEELEASKWYMKALNSKLSKDVIGWVGEKTDELGMKYAAQKHSDLAVIKSLMKGRTKDVETVANETYDQAMQSMRADMNDPNNSQLKKFMYDLSNAGPQMGIGMVLTIGGGRINPQFGQALGAAYWTAISANEQLAEDGEITSIEKIGIDVVGDMVLGNSLEAMFKAGAKASWANFMKSSLIEGWGTEVPQSFLKLDQDWQNAKTDEEREAVIEEAKNYVLSGDMAREGMVGTVLGGGAYVGTQSFISPNIDMNDTIVNVEGLPQGPMSKQDEIEDEDQMSFLPEEVAVKEDIITEAKKYKSAEEFVKAMKSGGDRSDIANRRYQAMNLNPTEIGSYSTFDIARMKQLDMGDLNQWKLSKQSLDIKADLLSNRKLAFGKNPKITIYRVLPKGQSINAGDFIFDSKELAKDYLNKYGIKRGSTEIKEIKNVGLDEILITDNPIHRYEDLVRSKGEFIYAPKKLQNTIKNESQLTDIFNKANKTEEAKTLPILEEGRSGDEINFIREIKQAVEEGMTQQQLQDLYTKEFDRETLTADKIKFSKADILFDMMENVEELDTRDVKGERKLLARIDPKWLDGIPTYKRKVKRSQAQEKRLFDSIERLGLTNVQVEFFKEIISKRGKTAFGTRFYQTISLADLTTMFTGEHELGHMVFNNMDRMEMFKGMSKREILKELRKIFPEVKTKKGLEEKLMRIGEKMAYDYKKTGKFYFKTDNKIHSFWKKIFLALKKFFTGKTNNPDAVNLFWKKVLTEKAKRPTKVKEKSFWDRDLSRYIEYDQADFEADMDEMHKGKEEEEGVDDTTNQVTNEDYAALEAEQARAETEVYYSDEKLQEQYDKFYKLKIPSQRLNEAEDVEALRKSYGGGMKDAAFDDMFYSQEMGMDDVYDMFRERIMAERQSKELAANNKAKYNKIRKAVTGTTKDDIPAISENLKKQIKAFLRPGKAKNSRAFGLLGNKDTTIPYFSKLFRDWAEQGVQKIIEPYARAFTLGTHSIKDSIQAGLKEYHANIFDIDKFIIVKAIQDGKLSQVKASYEKAAKKFNDTILKLGSQDKLVNDTFRAFMKKHPDSFIGSELWLDWVKGQEIGKQVTVFDDYRKRFSTVFQKAMDSMVHEKIRTVDAATENAFALRIGMRATKGQMMISNFGFKKFEDQIFGKFGTLVSLDEINETFTLAKEHGTEISLYNEDGMDMVNKIDRSEPEKIGYYLDPPYFASAEGTYKQQIKQQGEAGAEAIKKFAEPAEFLATHKDIVESGSRQAYTNDVNEDYVWGLIGDDGSKKKVFAYKEGMTPTSLVIDNLSEEATHEYFLTEKTSAGKWTDLDYIASRILKTDSGENIIAMLKKHGVSEDVIKGLKVYYNEDIKGQKRSSAMLKDLVRIKVQEVDGEKVVKSVISNKVLNYIQKTSKIKHIKVEDLKGVNKIFQKVKKTVAEFVQGYETGERFFDRIGQGFYDVIFVPVRSAEKRATMKSSQLKKRLVKGLSKKEQAKFLSYSLYKQGVTKDKVGFSELTPKAQFAYKEYRKIVKEMEPFVRRTAKKNGRSLGTVPNYLPLYTKDDLIIAEAGGLTAFTRNDPYFGSLKERVKDTDISLYEKNISKVMETWIDNATRYVELGGVTYDVNYLISSTQLQEIAGPQVTGLLKQWYRNVVNPPIAQGNWKFLKKIRAVRAFTILGGKISVILKQPLNLWDFAALVGWRRTVKAMFTANTPYWNQLANQSGSIQERTLGIAIQDIRSEALNFLGKPALYVDKMTAKMGYVAVLSQMMERERAEGRPIDQKKMRRMMRYADTIVDRVMGGMSRSEQPRYFRTELGKNMNMFFSQLNSKMQVYVTDIWKKETSEDLNQNRAKLMARSFMAVIIAGYVEAVISQLAMVGFDEDDEDYQDIASSIADSIIGNFPVINNVWYALKTGKPYAPAPTLGSFAKIMTNLAQGKFKDAAWEGTGFFYLPMQAQNILRGSGIVMEGGVYDKNGRLMYPVEGNIEQIRTILNGKWGSQAAKEYIEERKTTPWKFWETKVTPRGSSRSTGGRGSSR